MRGRRLFFAAVLLLSALALTAAPAASAASAVPRPDHVVVVVMENHSFANVVGSPSAPYMNSLAANGANMTQSYAETHPSQPNYIALFSGSLNGITSDACPATLNTPNLGAELISAGLTFVGYSEDLPAAGSTTCSAGNYARKHNPWVNFPSVPAASNQPLTAFPTDYSQLPTVSFVIPNLQNDMHDGTVAQADSWLQSHLGGYVDWATTHNSLLIVTWDEDNNTAINQIPTIIVGAGVSPGQYPEQINHYSVLRTLQDAYGLDPIGNSVTATPILDIWADSPNAPTASFTVTCTGLTCAVDGSASHAQQGSLTDYSWTWGDGTPLGSGVQTSHTYAAAGDYTIALTVTDDAGGTDATSRVAAARPAGGGSLFAADSFARTVANGLGAADIGGSWSTTGSSTNYSVAGGSAALNMKAGATNTIALPTVSKSDTDLRMTLSVDQIGGNNLLYLGVVGRHTAANTEYQGRLRLRGDGTVQLGIQAFKGSATAVDLKPQIALPGVTVTAGMLLKTRLQVVGTNPTTVSWKVWPSTSAEPAAWQLTGTDSYAALQTPGSIGFTAYLSSASTVTPQVTRIRDLSAQPTAAPPVNQPPTASFTVSCTNLTCSTNGNGSSDPDGTVAGYSWNWGDGSAATTGATSSHPYAAPGSYTVTLTVTDNGGATATTTRTANPTAPPVNQPPTASFSVSCTDLTCSANGAGSSDPDGTIAGYSWNWGDGSAATTGATSSHPYAAPGSYTVTLTVTDNGGATATTTRIATPTSAAAQPFASDTFARTVANGWGAANVGGSWSITGTANRFSVAGGFGSMLMPTAGTTVATALGAVSSSDTDLRLTLSNDKIANGNGTYLSVLGRQLGASVYYQARLKVSTTGVKLNLAAQNGTTAVTVRPDIDVPGLIPTAGVPFNVRLQVTGIAPTTLRVKVWPASGSEPSAWQLIGTDSTPGLQAPGGIGVISYLSSSSTVIGITTKVSQLSAVPVN